MEKIIHAAAITIMAFLFSGCATNKHTGEIPRGTIVAWKSNVYSAPAGWAICDAVNHGKNAEIPDLSGKFLKGLEPGEEIGNIGGSKTHSHNDVWHTGFNGQLRPHGDGVTAEGRNYIGHTGEASNMPPYYTVYYIIKL